MTLPAKFCLFCPDCQHGTYPSLCTVYGTFNGHEQIPDPFVGEEELPLLDEAHR